MGVYAAHCMAGMAEDRGADMAFEMFTHVTRFLGKKVSEKENKRAVGCTQEGAAGEPTTFPPPFQVVLLGLYNGQRLEHEPAEDMISYSRVSEGPDRTFVRVLLLRGRVQGAVLIGDTGETACPLKKTLYSFASFLPEM